MPSKTVENNYLFSPSNDGTLRIDKYHIPEDILKEVHSESLSYACYLIEHYGEEKPEYAVRIMYDCFENCSVEDFYNLIYTSPYLDFKVITSVLAGLIVNGCTSKESGKTFVRSILTIVGDNEERFEDFFPVKDIPTQEYLICDALDQLPVGETTISLCEQVHEHMSNFNSEN